MSAEQSTGPTGVTALSWSTLHVPKAGQFAHWRELICEAFLDLTPESDGRDGFVGQVTQVPLGELAVARIRSQAQGVRRTPRDIERAPRRGYYANLQVRGDSLMTQGGRSTVLRPGDLAVVDTTEPFAFGFRDDFQQLSFHVPQELLAAQTDPPVPTATRISTATGVGAALRHALHALVANRLPATAATRLAVHTGGMLAVAIQLLAHPADPDRRDAGARHQRWHAAALADIEEHIGDDDLSPLATARRLGVSVRQLHAIFAGREHSYAAEIRRRRLEIARRDLTDPARAHLRIIDISVEAGFANVASFHRAFRQRFGRTPAQVRAAAIAPDPHTWTT